MIRALQQEGPFIQSSSSKSTASDASYTRRPRVSSTQPALEEALQLVQRFFLLPVGESPAVVVFAGVEHGNGCSQVCASVAEALAANTPAKVCLLEANFRSPGLAAFFGVGNEQGFSDALLREDSIWAFARQLSLDNLWLISSGTVPVKSPISLGIDNLTKRIADLRSEFDYVIVDAPPLAVYADALSLSQCADGVVLVLEADSTRREAAQEAAEILRAAQIRIVGAVLNKRAHAISKGFFSKR